MIFNQTDFLKRAKKIILATKNKNKVCEIVDFLIDFGFNITTQNDCNISKVEETGTTFVENAIIKARHASKETGYPAISDDSGLEVDYLQGEPGIHSARYAGVNASDEQNLNKLLKKMQRASEKQRAARFHCVLVLIRHTNDPVPLICHGKWEGRISKEAHGKNGFGYDPIFFIPEEQCTSAELETNRKQQLSHRAKALKKLFMALSAQNS
ncbi:nucleoside 5-triphosphatase [Candidatus Photodesmus blepharus]|uniref:dITP/XTP pyrophosphatase n=1 Tax=Candidatus Photodesmus blepharonis TaxID=1179155 RepID=A0A084CM29_9GAMM|nr:RdgB/HAM1 family non-canonical purine NTP pyrophosphatase [Candidatus Photodesmus blepharus]KEY90858.1 nucleoside 5-triphosphatase [Candidatus Photodesmus blepharus]